jgi:hypothetical protein
MNNKRKMKKKKKRKTKPKPQKNLGINLTKEMKDLYNKEYKTLKEDTRR